MKTITVYSLIMLFTFHFAFAQKTNEAIDLYRANRYDFKLSANYCLVNGITLGGGIKIVHPIYIIGEISPLSSITHFGAPSDYKHGIRYKLGIDWVFLKKRSYYLEINNTFRTDYYEYETIYSLFPSINIGSFYFFKDVASNRLGLDIKFGGFATYVKYVSLPQYVKYSNSNYNHYHPYTYFPFPSRILPNATIGLFYKF